MRNFSVKQRNLTATIRNKAQKHRNNAVTMGFLQ